SGCGKTTMARMLMKLHDPTEGSIEVDGRDIAQVQTKQDVKKWHANIQMIFQDPFASLNPAKTIENIIGRTLTLHFPSLSSQQVYDRVKELLTLVGLTPAEDFMGKHPAQLSGGQRQRIVIARALAVEPEILVADEPTSMLDVSIGIDIMNLLLELKAKKHLTMMYITHNLASARYIADDMVVMYAGNAVEYGDIDEIIAQPYHPYTVLLLNSTPEPFREHPVDVVASEELPDLKKEQTGCLFCQRCPLATDRCRSEIPPEYVLGARRVKCFLYEKGLPENQVDVGIYARKERA
ncbi:MAG: ABC transporter ATP-binding protein, partial [Eubacteriales bacterium]|nr:ABC transporter ATP-binding protein [Eubacteriales bacterium]